MVDNLKKQRKDKDERIAELVEKLQNRDQIDLKTTMDFHKKVQLKEMELYQKLKDSEMLVHKLQQEKELWKINEQKLLSEIELTHLREMEHKA